MRSKSEIAVAKFLDGYNCAQAVFHYKQGVTAPLF